MNASNTEAAVLMRALKLIEGYLCIPDGYALACQRKVIQDARPLLLLRHERSDGRNTGLGGEHFSVLINLEEERLDGVHHMDRRYSNAVPEEQVALQRAREFLAAAAPDLAKRAEERWVKPLRKEPLEPPHDSGFAFVECETGGSRTAIGVRVKMFDATTGTWAWVVVGHDGGIVSFERDISWDSQRKRRMTEQWLHDPWVDRLIQTVND